MPPRLMFAGFLGLLLMLPLVASEFHVTLLNYIGLYAIVALGLVLLTGVGGLTSFGQAAFVGLGAYTTAYLSTAENLPGWASILGGSPWMGLLVGLLVTALVAYLLGLLTLRLSGHYLPHTRGAIRFLGQKVGDAEVEQMVSLGINLVPESRALFGEMSVADNLLLGAFMRHREGHRDHEQTMEEVFQIFPRLKERRSQHAGTLSGGERQMLALARALMAKPKLLLLDEPSLGLAPLIVREIFRVIADLKKNGVSILLVEQNARAALQVADYAYVLETGEIALEGASDQLVDNPRVVESCLGLAANIRALFHVKPPGYGFT